MRILRSLVIAFATYSRIPMPRVSWEKENLSLSIAFLPLVGAVIGAGEYLLFWGGALLGLPALVRALLAAALPVLITGGIHLDGFMDTKDALNSFRPREEKLRILKDSHVGAFAVIRLVLYFLIFLAAAAELAALPVNVKEVSGAAAGGTLETANAFVSLLGGFAGASEGIWFAAFGGFVLARCLAAFFLILGKSARKEGLAYTFASGADRRAGILLLGAESGAVLLPSVLLSPLTTVLLLVFMGGYSLWFLRMAGREFGGLTGDLLGMAITELELCAFLAGAAAAFVRLLPV